MITVECRRKGEAIDISTSGTVEPNPGGVSPAVPPKAGVVGGVKAVAGVLVFGVFIEPPAVLQETNELYKVLQFGPQLLVLAK